MEILLLTMEHCLLCSSGRSSVWATQDLWLCAHSCPALCNPVDCSPSSSSIHGILPGKNTGVDCHFLLQGDLPGPGMEPSLPCLLHYQANSLPHCTIQDSKGSLNHSITIVNLCLVKRASNYCPPKSSFLPSTNSTKIALKGLTQYINICAVPGIVKIIVMTGV